MVAILAVILDFIKNWKSGKTAWNETFLCLSLTCKITHWKKLKKTCIFRQSSSRLITSSADVIVQEKTEKNHKVGVATTPPHSPPPLYARGLRRLTKIMRWQWNIFNTSRKITYCDVIRFRNFPFSPVHFSSVTCWRILGSGFPLNLLWRWQEPMISHMGSGRWQICILTYCTYIHNIQVVQPTFNLRHLRKPNTNFAISVFSARRYI